MIDFLLNFKNPVFLGLIATVLFVGFSLLFYKLYILPLKKENDKLKKHVEELQKEMKSKT